MRSVLVVLVVLLLVPAAAHGQGQTRGHSLSKPANATFGCESVPDLEFGFNAGLFMNPALGSASCTWFDAGAAFSPAGTEDFAGGNAPGTGIVTKVRVRSGANPSPLRVVILESLVGVSTAVQGGSCCSGERESQVFQPAPNAVTEVEVNLPVTVDQGQGVTVIDKVGISANADGGTLPVFDPGPAAHTVEAGTVPGVHTAVVFSPALAPNGVASFNGRAAPGWELLMQFDWVPCAQRARLTARAAQACATAPPPPPPPPPPGAPAAIAGGPLRASAGAVPVAVTCGAAGGCEGVLRLVAGGRTLGRRAVTVLPGATKTLRVKLSAQGRRRVARRRRTPAQAILVLADGRRVVQSVVIRR